MNWDIAKSLAIKVAPVVLGVVLGIGGTKAVETKPTAQPVTVECKCVTPKPDPIKVEFIRK